MNNQKLTGHEKSFVTEAAIISVSNFAVKIIGVLYKIPLSNTLQSSMGIFTAAYSIYAMLYMVSTAGLPVAISRMTASAASKGKTVEIKKIFRVSLLIFGIIGLVCSLFLFFAAKPIADWSRHEDSVLAMRVISPTLFIICIASAIRGYYQGLRNMYPTAISQFIEAFVKLCIGLGGALIAKKMGYSPSVQAAAAISGLTLGVLCGTVFMIIYRCFSKKKYFNTLSVESSSYKTLAKSIGLIALPVTLTSSALYLSQFLDTLLIKKCLIFSGMIETASEAVYTAYTALAISISDLLPSTLVYPIAISILPAVAGALAVKDKLKADRYVDNSIRISGIIALPCAFCLAALSRPAIALLYRYDWGEPIQTFGGLKTPLDIASPALSLLALGIFGISIVSTTTSLLQACGKVYYPLISVASGVAVLIVSETTLVSIPKIGIFGAPISSVACYTVAMLVNLHFLRKNRGLKLSFFKLFGKPAFCAFLSGVAAFAVNKSMFLLLQGEGRLNCLIVLVAAAIVAVAVYVLLLLVLKGITAEEIRLLPLGDKICNFVIKRGWLK